MPSHTSITDVKAALKKHSGLLAPAAAELGIARQSLHERIVRSNELRAYIREIEDAILDSVESVVIKAIEKGDMRTARWYLERKAKHRGYTMSLDVEGRINEMWMEAFSVSLGGDPNKFRAALDAIRGVPYTDTELEREMRNRERVGAKP